MAVAASVKIGISMPENYVYGDEVPPDAITGYQHKRDLMVKGEYESEANARELVRTPMYILVDCYKGRVDPRSIVRKGLVYEMPAVEIIVEWGHPLLRKVMWLASPYEAIMIDGVLNPCHHTNMCATHMEDWNMVAPDEEPVQVRAARYRCRESFVTYWSKRLTERYTFEELVAKGAL